MERRDVGRGDVGGAWRTSRRDLKRPATGSLATRSGATRNEATRSGAGRGLEQGRRYVQRRGVET